jgi:ATP-dependent DNA helicase RecQ
MGYAKPDLSLCIHVGSPDSPVAYYQQVGRAGRAIERADAILLPAETDERLWQFFATASIPDVGNIEKVLRTLEESGETMSVPTLEGITGVRRGRLEALLKIVAVEGVVERVANGWRSTGTPYVYDEEKWTAIRAARAVEADLMRSYAGGRGCLMEFLQQALDDPDPGACGRCSVCTQELPVQGFDISTESVSAARVYLRGADIVIEPRKLWPKGVADGRGGRITGAGPGRALTYADSPEWREVVGAMSGPDLPLDDEVFGGIVSVLSRWRGQWAERPVAVVPIPSRHHPRMIMDLATRIAEIGKLAVIDALEVTGPRPPDTAASLLKVDTLVTGLHLRPGVVLPIDGPVLLVDDTYRSGWMMTFAAALLREAGVSAVMPLVVHQLP